MILKIHLLSLAISSLIFESVSSKHFHGKVVVPGVGTIERLQLVFNNILYLEEYLHRSNLQWDCSIVVYASLNYSSQFWYEGRKYVEHLKRTCELMICPNCSVAENLRFISPESLLTRYKYVFILLDDVKLRRGGQYKFLLDKFIRISEYNNSTMSSPRIRRSTGGTPGLGRDLMSKLPSSPSSPGYVVRYIEIFATLLTVHAYQASKLSERFNSFNLILSYNAGTLAAISTAYQSSCMGLRPLVRRLRTHSSGWSQDVHHIQHAGGTSSREKRC